MGLVRVQMEVTGELPDAILESPTDYRDALAGFVAQILGLANISAVEVQSQNLEKTGT